MLRIFLLGACAALLGCAGAPAPAPGRAAAWGYVRLVPHEGWTPAPAGGGAYGDRRLADVTLVDYGRPGFAVVWADGPTPAPGRLALQIRGAAARAALEPAHGAVGVGGELLVTNESADAHLLSVPAAGVLRRLPPGTSASIPVERAGELTLFLLDAPGQGARVFAPPGPFAVASEAGRFELADLPPGPRRLHVWHPRFPPAVRSVELAPGRAQRVDLELGVGAEEGAAHAP